MRSSQDFPFDSLERSFAVLTAEPRPLSLDLNGIGGGLPARVMPLDQLRNRLLHPSVSHAARNLAVRQLADLAKESPAYVIGLAGVLLPGMRRASAAMIEVCPEHAADLQAEMLTGLLEALAETSDLDRPASSLVWAAVRRARKLLLAELAHATRRAETELLDAYADRPLCSHPDLLLDEAVRRGVISWDEAELVGQTRLNGADLAQISAQQGIAYNTLQKRRRRAELTLKSWIYSESSSAEGPKSRFMRVRGRSREGRLSAATGCATDRASKEVSQLTHPRGAPPRIDPAEPKCRAERSRS